MREPRIFRLSRQGVLAVAITAIATTVAVAAIVWPGYDAQQTPLDDGTVWALQRSAGGNYARVNTELGEIDTVKTVEQPTALTQSAAGLWLFTAAATKVSRVDAATPADLTTDLEDAYASTPAGTREVVTAGSRVLYLTDAGDVTLGDLSTGALTPVDILDAAGDPIAVTAVALTDSGEIAAYSPSQGLVIRADADGHVIGTDAVVDAPGDQAALTLVGDRWVLFDPDTGTLWIQGQGQPISSSLADGALLQVAADTGTEVFVADTSGLVGVGLDDGEVRQVFGGAQTLGTPAAPVTTETDVLAAWLPPTGDGVMWSQLTGTSTALAYAGQDLDTEILPVFATNGSRTILNETQSGWVWTAPDGTLVPSSQAWQIEADSAAQQTEAAPAAEVIDPRPPVAVDDTFGVRAGRSVLLPVLLNDHDPNEDVLTVQSDSITASGFGMPAATNGDGMIVLDIPEDAEGTRSFSYRVSDGTTGDGLLSGSATVTLTVIDDEVNTAPVWCGVDACLATWPEPETVPGGTVTVPVLDGFVDPESDGMYVLSAAVTSGTGTVTVDPTGSITYQHPDPNATAVETVTIMVIVSDTRGATTERALTVEVTPTASLQLSSFSTTTVAGRTLTIDLSGRITGASGTATLAAVSATPDSADITVNPAGLSFSFTAPSPGSTTITYTVRDERGGAGTVEASGTVRITTLAAGATPLSTPPLVAFVRPSEDTTVNVLDAVSNPAQLVLLLSDLRPEPAEGATLSVDPVGQSTIRASGTTADGAAGELGVVRYSISDGTDDGTAAIEGQLTLVLLPAASADPPIAVDDTAVVRAGALVDIPVLENDSAPAGGLLAIDPSRVVNESDAGLAFATSRTVRYLAPDEPGVYSVSYTVSRLGFPELTDTARITVTVQDGDTNTAPTPVTLEGRALSGRSTLIAFDPFGLDADGDTVVLSAVIDQPTTADGEPAGTAAISADGSSLVYTAPTGWSGQASFSYQVRDARGATATALALIGVRDAQSDPRPVTFSDYVQIEGGEDHADNQVTVSPLDGDIDPAGGELSLVEVRPNAELGTAEYEALAAQLLEVDTDSGTVTLRAGPTLGTSSFVYTAATASGDTAMGLIVVKVVRDPVPNYPEVRDTVLTAETIDAYATGVDVLTDKISWSGGDPAILSLSLWGENPGVRVSGSSISGTVSEQAALIPFTVTGVDYTGREVTSYGFLRVPGLNDLRPTLREGTSAITVDEDASVDVDLAALIAVPRGSTLEIGTDVTTGGARAQATCTLISADTVRYAAGRGAPWTDSCIVPTRLAGEDAWTYLSVPIAVIAEAPQPVLNAAARTIGPGQSETYDLRQLTTWTGTPDWSSLTYEVAYDGDQFEVVLEGSTLQITAEDAARPGRTESVIVRLASHRDATAATLTLAVGPAPSTLPKAATVSQQCSQAGGTTSCTIQVVGAAGEVNPLPGTPLTLVSTSSPANCPEVTYEVASATAIRATWSADAPGAADCAGSYVLADAQGRLTAGERAGTAILDLRGLPADATSIEWTAFTADSVTLRVTSARSSYPAVEGYIVTGGGQEYRCDADGTCPAIPADAGVKTAYQARAVNSVGSARAATTPVTAWAYASPAAPTSASAVPVATSDGSGGVAAVTVGGFDATTGSVRVTSPVSGATQTLPVPSGSASVTFPEFDVGANVATTLTITPLSRFDYPTIATGSAEGSSRTVVASGVGAPRLSLSVTPTDDGSGVVEAVATVAANAVDATLWVGISTSATCTLHRVGETTSTVLSEDLPGTPWEDTAVFACAEYRIGGTSFGRSTVGPVTAQPTEPLPAPSGTATYTIAPTPTVAGATVSWTGITPPSFPHDRYETRYGATRTTDFASLFRTGEAPGAIQAYWCVGSACSGSGTTVTPSGAAYTAQVVFPTTCDADGNPAATTVTAASGDYSLAQTGTPSADTTSTDWEITVTWTGNLTGLDPYTYTALSCATP
ncbi:hypothetical protein GCM10009808_14170 [Microbacterium sediminicola]|uniref:Cadherin domain-containing protein n=1 Tax=Microbacterium sediminicola TaxID=415210 RepID=A0ABN2I3A5_9MICO